MTTLAERSLRVAMLGHIPADDVTIIADMQARIERLEHALREIMKASVEGRVCDDVAWFDMITTLYDYCDQAIGDPQ